MAAISAATSNARTVVGRTVHIKIHPRPRNITESREILRVLQSYGEITMFKNLKYEPGAPAPNTALAIYRKDEAAERAMDASPIKFVYGEVGRVDEMGSEVVLSDRVHRQERGKEETATPTHDSHNITGTSTSLSAKEGTDNIESAGGGAQTEPNAPATTPSKRVKWQSMPNLTPASTVPTSSPIQPALTTFPRQPPPTSPSISPVHCLFDPRPPEPRLPALPCSLTVAPSGLNHAAYISRQHYYGPFHPSSRTIPGEDLELRVPLAGYADLSLGKPEVPIRVRAKRDKEGRRGLLAETEGGLRGLWEWGQQQRERERRRRERAAGMTCVS